MWLDKLKIALVEKNTDSINALLDDIPQLSDPKEMEQAVYLLREALELVYTLKDETADSMQRIKKSISFLKSTQVEQSAKLDIKL